MKQEAAYGGTVQPGPQPQPWWMARGDHDLPPTDDWLTRREADAAAGMRTTKRRSEYLLRRWVCKHTVAVASGLSAEPASLARIEVANSPSGAPYVRLDGAPLEQAVSMSDRAGWAVCVLGPDRSPVGCDIELLERRSPAFVADFFTRSEQTFVAARPPVERDAAANLIWSAKESALKVLQTGLRRDTRSVEVTLRTTPGEYVDADTRLGWAPLEVQVVDDRLLRGWWRRDGMFLVTVATEESLGPPRALPGSTDLGSARPSHVWLGRPPSPWSERLGP